MKRLIFHFYLPDNWRELQSIKIHLNCLKEFAFVFNEAVFVLSMDNIADKESILEIEHLLVESGYRNVEFKVRKRTYLYESETLYNEIVKKLDRLDGLTFFGHSKGVFEEINGNGCGASLKAWICGLYYLSMSFVDEAEIKLYTKKAISFGSYLTKDMSINNKGHWAYCGAFFWINAQKLQNKLIVEDISLRLPSDMFFAECFLGDILDIEGLIKDGSDSEVSSHFSSHLINANNFLIEAEFYTRFILDEFDLRGLNEFKKKVINDGEIHA